MQTHHKPHKTWRPQPLPSLVSHVPGPWVDILDGCPTALSLLTFILLQACHPRDFATSPQNLWARDKQRGFVSCPPRKCNTSWHCQLSREADQLVQSHLVCTTQDSSRPPFFGDPLREHSGCYRAYVEHGDRWARGRWGQSARKRLIAIHFTLRSGVPEPLHCIKLCHPASLEWKRMHWRQVNWGLRAKCWWRWV